MTSHARPLIAWFVSDHGWGHAARQRELMLMLREACPGSRITVVTGVPQWFWEPLGDMRYLRWASGPVPREHPGGIDHDGTRMSLLGFPERVEDLAGECRGIIRVEKPSLVVTDIDPVPAAAAFQEGVDSIAVANFTWDWIYREMFPDLGGICDTVAGLYRTAHYFRLPLGPSHVPFDTSEEVGLVPGGSPRSASRAREILGQQKTLLVTLRDPGRLGVDTLELPHGWHAVCSLPFAGLGGVENIPPHELGSRGLIYADLAAASDALLISPGYGTVSMALALGKPLIALERDDFPEVPYLLEPLHDRPSTVLCNARDVGGAGLADLIERISGEPMPVPLACDTEYVVSQISTRAGQGMPRHNAHGREEGGV